MEDSNILIAEFMGFSYEKNIGYYDDEMLLSQCVYDLNGGNCFDELQFHKSWDWLMPVAKKIKLMDIDLEHWRMITNPSDYPIENVHNQIVYFIKQHNKS